MARKVKAGTAVAYLHEQPGEDWNGKVKWDGPGYYEVISDDDDNHTQAHFGSKVLFRLDKANPEGEPPNPENNEGHWVYATGDDDE